MSAPPPFIGDSIIVYYNDTTHITHYRIGEQLVSRSLFDANSWAGDMVEEYSYRYEYTFSNDDYNEAIGNQ